MLGFQEYNFNVAELGALSLCGPPDNGSKLQNRNLPKKLRRKNYFRCLISQFCANSTAVFTADYK